jgi:hypothetical protein
MALPQCLLYNGRPVTANITVRKNHITALMNNYNSDLAFITETWLRKTHSDDDCEIQGYRFF